MRKRLVVGVALAGLVVFASMAWGMTAPPKFKNSFSVYKGATLGLRAVDPQGNYFRGVWTFPTRGYTGTTGCTVAMWYIVLYTLKTNDAGTASTIADSVEYQWASQEISELGPADSCSITILSSTAACTTTVVVEGDANSATTVYGQP